MILQSDYSTTAKQEKPQEAEVIAVGPGTEDVKMEVSVGQKVIYSKYAGTEVKLENCFYFRLLALTHIEC